MAFNLNKNGDTPSNGEGAKPTNNKFNLAKNEVTRQDTEVIADKRKPKKPWLVIIAVLIVGGSLSWYFLASTKKDNQPTINPVIASTTAPQDSSPRTTAPKDSVTVANTTPNNNAGTPTPTVKELHRKVPASFAKGAIELEALDAGLIQNVLAFLQQNNTASITIAGYASSEGPLSLNQQISQQRAVAFKNYLIAKGIPSKRIITVGNGIANPIANNDAEEGRQKNRRVEIVFNSQ